MCSRERRQLVPQYAQFLAIQNLGISFSPDEALQSSQTEIQIAPLLLLETRMSELQRRSVLAHSSDNIGIDARCHVNMNLKRNFGPRSR